MNSYENIIESMKPFNDKLCEGNDVSMTSVEDVRVSRGIPDECGKDSLLIMKDNHVTELLRKQNVNECETKNKKLKCSFENTGTCRKKNCRNYHPKKTCQNYSNYGVCSFRECELRHPWGVCHIWQQHGACFYGERCRNRHPVELSRQQNVTFASENRFLGVNNNRRLLPYLPPYLPPMNLERRNNC